MSTKLFLYKLWKHGNYPKTKFLKKLSINVSRINLHVNHAKNEVSITYFENPLFRSWFEFRDDLREPSRSNTDKNGTAKQLFELDVDINRLLSFHKSPEFNFSKTVWRNNVRILKSRKSFLIGSLLSVQGSYNGYVGSKEPRQFSMN